MNIINVLIIPDAARIMQEVGPNDGAKTGNYIMLPNNGQSYLYMVTTWMAAQGEGSNELSVYAEPGDTIRFRMIDLSFGNKFQCFITHFIINAGADLIDPPKAAFEAISMPQVDTTNPSLNSVIEKTVNDVYWDTTVRGKGKVTYHTEFCVCGDGCNSVGDNLTVIGGSGGSGGSGCGGYQWDPFIIIQ